jgi:hypothetical protein
LKLTATLCCLLVSCPSFAQRNLKYENVVKKAAEAAPDEAFGMYAEYLGANPLSERANLYFKLAGLASDMMKTLDPIDNYGEIKALRNQSKEYYMVCEKYLNDDNVRKDQLFYSGVSASRRRLAASDVVQHIRNKLEADSIFFEDAEFAVGTYGSMLDSYYRCVDIYREICDNNRTVNDIYVNMEANADLFAALKDAYDSVFAAADRMKTKFAKLNLSVRKLKDFKIDGFVPAKFRPAGELWDYKSWAVEHERYYSENVLPVISASSKLKQRIYSLADEIKKRRRPIRDTLSGEDEKLLKRLGEMRHITSLYGEIEQKLKVANFLNLAYDPKNTSEFDGSPDRRAARIYALKNAYDKATEGARNLAEHYPSLGRDAAETELMDALYRGSIANYGRYAANIERATDKDTYFIHEKANIPKRKGGGFYRSPSSGYVLKSVAENADGSLFLGGAYVNAQGFSVAFTAFSDNAQNIVWIKTADIAKMIYDDCSMSVCAVPGGVMSLIVSKNVSDPSLVTHTIARYDAKGNEKQKITLSDKNLPVGRLIFHDEITETTTLAFFGDSENNRRDSGTLIVQQLAKDNRQLFRSEMKLNGNLLNIFPSDNGRLLLFGNYSDRGAADRKLSERGVFSALMDKDGKILKTSFYPADVPRYGMNVSRLSIDRFLIAGSTGRLENEPSSPDEGKPVFILTDAAGDKIYDYKNI